MPIYEYQCSNCSHAYELLQKASDEPDTKCPSCSKNTSVRLISAAGFQLKGTGWYATDFKNKGKVEKTETTSSTKTASPETKTTTDSVSSTKE